MTQTLYFEPLIVFVSFFVSCIRFHELRQWFELYRRPNNLRKLRNKSPKMLKFYLKTLSFSTEFVYFHSLVSFRHGFSVIYFLRSFMLSIEKIPTWHIGHPHNITQYQWLVCVRLATIITNQNRTFHLLSNRMGHFSSSNFSHWVIWISLNKWLWFTRC